MIYELNQIKKKNNLKLLDIIAEVIIDNSKFIPDAHR